MVLDLKMNEWQVVSSYYLSSRFFIGGKVDFGACPGLGD
jgi:hypothetical protein